MELLYALEAIRTPFLDKLMTFFSLIGGETFFFALGIIVLWCINKKCGFYIMTVGFTGTIISQFLKLWFRIPRPWVKDPDFTILETARAEATGYSFPSGHTVNAFATYGAPATYTKKKLLKVILYLIIPAIAFSRMYAGVHTPLDVGVSLGIGLIFMFVFYPLFRDMDERPDQVYMLFLLFIIAAIAFVLFVELYAFPADVDPVNLAEGAKSAYMILFCSIGLLLVFHLDRTKIHYVTDAVWWAQIIKVAIGLSVTLGLKAALKAPLLSLFNGHAIAHGIRYFIVILFGGILWPLTFKWFSKLGRK